MINVTPIKDVTELIKCWKRILFVTKQDNPDVTPDQLLQICVNCLDNGAVFVVRNDGSICGVCCVEAQDDFTLTLRSIPNDKGTGVAKACIEAVRDWGRKNLYGLLEVSTERLNGSSFRYFEKSLGFRRKYVTFTLLI